MRSTIQIGKKGRIIDGDSAGHFVLIQDDAANTGGYLILTAKDLNFQDGFDEWVENLEMLKQYFEEAHWEIEWLE